MRWLCLLAVALLACEPRAVTPQVPPAADRWWVAECGEVDPLGVAAHGIDPPRLLHRVQPDFPMPSSSRGSIIIETVLTDHGEVCAARILRGLNVDLNARALAAIRQWRFTPVRVNGQPRAAFFNITVSIR